MHVYLVDEQYKVVSYFGQGTRALRKANRSKKNDLVVWQSTVKFSIGDKV